MLLSYPSETGIGLIERVKRGQGRSDLIYVMSFDLPKDAEDKEGIRNLRDKNSRNDTYRSKIDTVKNVDNSSDEVVGKTDPNYNKYNNTEYNNSPVQSCHITEDDDWIDHIDCSKPIKITGYYPQIQRQDRQDEIQPDKADYIEYLKRNIGYDGIATNVEDTGMRLSIPG